MRIYQRGWCLGIGLCFIGMLNVKSALSAKQWEILGSHFVNAQGKPFTDWDSQHDPKRGARTLERFAEVLNIHSDPPRIDTLTDEISEELKEFGDWEQFER